jgi:hypothetical protein
MTSPAAPATPAGPADASRSADPARAALRQKLVAARLALPDRLERAVELRSLLRAWLAGRPESTIGAYWPIKASSIRCWRSSAGARAARMAHRAASA